MVLFRSLIAAACLVLAGCSDYPQETPDAVLVSARKMVERGDADRLPDLIYAESKEMRTLLDELGRALGSLHDLAAAVQQAYPEEVAKLRDEAAAAAKEGNASGFLQGMIGQARQGDRGGRSAAPRDPEAAQSAFDNAMKELFADPYGWLERSEGRLSVVTQADDVAAIQWDGKPAFGVGLMMVRKDGRWYIALPTALPGAGRLTPRTAEGWEILGAVVQVFDNMLIDLTREVKSGRCRRLEDLAARAGEQAFVPAALAFIAYGKYMEAERPAGQTPRPRRAEPRPAPSATPSPTPAPDPGPP